MSIVNRLDGFAEKHPDKLLYVFLDGRGQEVDRYNFAHFTQKTRALAKHLIEDFELQRGDRVLLAYPAGLDMIAAFYACARAGIIAVPVPPLEVRGADAALNRINHIAEDCDARAILSTRAGYETAERAVGCDVLAAHQWLTTDDRELDLHTDFADQSHETLFLQYTSGSTSQPKGVIVSHDNILHNRGLVLTHEDPIAVTWLPQHHDMGLIGYYLYVGLTGGTTYGFSPTTFIQRPLLWLEAITRYQATCSSAPNFAYEYCLRPGRITPDRLAKLDLSSLKILMAAAEPINPHTYQRFLHTFRPCGLNPDSYMVAYGLAENTLAVTSFGTKALSLAKKDLALNKVRVTENTSAIAGSKHLLSCGAPLGDIDVTIACPDRHMALPTGRVGEIWISGASKCTGYWNKPQASLESFEARLITDNGKPSQARYLRTGDMGFFHEGELYVCGRTKDMMIVRGQNIFPQDIETVAEQASPEVRKAGCAAFEAELDGRSQLVLLAETGAKVETDPVEVVQAVRTALGVELDQVLFVAPRDVPKTSSGKVMRFAARQRFLDGALTIRAAYERDPDAADMGPADQDRPFAQLLNRYQLSGTETQSLLDAGVDSLDLVLFMHELQELLAAQGGADIADEVDVRLVQRMSVADMVSVAEMLIDAPDDAILAVRKRLAEVKAAQRAQELRLMREDVTQPLDFINPPAVELLPRPARHVLLTGATGFLGPFLLHSLLEQTRAHVSLLVRAASEAEGLARMRSSIRLSGLGDRITPDWETRVSILCGSLEQPHMGLEEVIYETLATGLDAIYHNGALVNYLFDYARMRGANVDGTVEILKLAAHGTPTPLNLVSTTFIHGWATKPVLLESDGNEEMALLDFGYSQSKWVSDRLVARAGEAGLPVRIFRPALITPSAEGEGNNFDISIRLMAFMVKHGIGVTAQNQVSFLPADVTANNIVAISGLPDTMGGTYHVVRDDYSHMADFTNEISRQIGRRFDLYPLSEFVPEVIRRCTREDLLFPLLDFLINSIDNISSMEFKRYDSTQYQKARNRSPHGQADPDLTETVAGILTFLDRKGAIDPGLVGKKTDQAEPVVRAKTA